MAIIAIISLWNIYIVYEDGVIMSLLSGAEGSLIFHGEQQELVTRGVKTNAVLSVRNSTADWENVSELRNHTQTQKTQEKVNICEAMTL